MASDRRLRLLSRLTGMEPAEPTTGGICRLATEVSGTSGAGIMLFHGGLSRGTLATTDEVSARIEDLQFTLGEGPCIDACAGDRPVAEGDLSATARWPAFSPQALGFGARAVFAFPVRVGGAQLGALDLYRGRPGSLAPESYADVLMLADMAAELILLLQADAPPGQLAAELEAGADFRYVVHQAAGMMAVQLETTVTDALVRLRAHAFVTSRPLTAVAHEVVTRHLRFGPPGDEIR